MSIKNWRKCDERRNKTFKKIREEEKKIYIKIGLFMSYHGRDLIDVNEVKRRCGSILKPFTDVI